MTLFGAGSDQEKEQQKKNENSSQHHVYKIVEVTGKPYYGYHKKEHRFCKIYLYNPHLLKRAADLLVSGAVMGQILQPHYSHVPYALQVNIFSIWLPILHHYSILSSIF